MEGAKPRAAIRAWRAPDLPRSEHCGRLTASRLTAGADALLALFEAIAVTVHFEDEGRGPSPAPRLRKQPLYHRAFSRLCNGCAGRGMVVTVHSRSSCEGPLSWCSRPRGG